MSNDPTGLSGLSITAIRPMTPPELDAEGWLAHGPAPPMLVLADGSVLYASQDPQGTGPGTFLVFGANRLDDVISRGIEAGRPATRDELARHGWSLDRIDGPPTVLDLSGGVTLIPSRDLEGTGPGALFGILPDQTSVGWFNPPTGQPPGTTETLE